LASLGHPSKIQRVSRLGSVTGRPSSSGRQPKFAALNRGRQLYTFGRAAITLGIGPHSSLILKLLYMAGQFITIPPPVSMFLELRQPQGDHFLTLCLYDLRLGLQTITYLKFTSYPYPSNFKATAPH